MQYIRLKDELDGEVEVALSTDSLVSVLKPTAETGRRNQLIVGSRDVLPPHVDYPLPPDNAWGPRVPTSVFVRNIFAMTIMTFVMECSRGMFIASLWLMVEHTGGSKLLNSSLVALFSVGRMISNIVCGYAADAFSEKKVLLAITAVAILAHVMYIAAYETASPELLLASRVLAGLGTGAISVTRAHTAKITTVGQRTKYMALNGAAQFCGVALSPIFALGVGKLHSASPVLNRLALPGYAMVMLNVINMAIQGLVFISIQADVHANWPNGEAAPTFVGDVPYESDSDTSVKELLGSSRHSQAISDENEDDSDDECSDPVVSAQRRTEWERLVFLGMGIYLFINFTMRGLVAVVETVGTPVLLELRGTPGDHDASDLLFSALGGAGLVTFALTAKIAQVIPETSITVAGFLGLVAGSIAVAVSASGPLWGVCLGFALVWSVAFPVLNTTVISSFSKIIGSKNQGALMGWMGTAGSIGRIILPAVSALVSTAALFTLSAVLACVSVILLFWYMHSVRLFNRRQVIMLNGLDPDG